MQAEGLTKGSKGSPKQMLPATGSTNQPMPHMLGSANQQVLQMQGRSSVQMKELPNQQMLTPTKGSPKQMLPATGSTNQPMPHMLGSANKQILLTEEEKELVKQLRAVAKIETSVDTEVTILERILEEVRDELLELLRWRRLKWSRIPVPCRLVLMPFLSVRDTLCLDTAVAEKKAREHLMTAYKGLRTVAFDEHWYSGKHDFGGVRWVMNRDIDIRNMKMRFRGTTDDNLVLWHLLDKRKERIATYFTSRRAVSNVDFGNTLNEASKLGYLEVVRSLISRGVDINLSHSGGKAALHLASEHGHVEIVQALVNVGANVNQSSNEGQTSLHLAAKHGHPKVVQALLDAKADINKSNGEGWTPIHMAALNGHERVADALISAGADVNLSSMRGWKPLSIAETHGHSQVAALIRNAGGYAA